MKNPKRKYVLNIGESIITSSPGEIICYGLGSCVGVFIYDKINKVAAAAHIMLPEADHKYNDNVLTNLINGIFQIGCISYMLNAKIVGGANVLPYKHFEIGKRNVEFAKQKLIENKISIHGQHTGGKISRTAFMNVENGKIKIRSGNFFTEL